MSDPEEPWAGAGATQGAAVGPVEPPDREDESAESAGEIEIPLGMPLPPAEMRRLKAAAEQHCDVNDGERQAQSDSGAQPDST
jgi:hypothetical protein